MSTPDAGPAPADATYPVATPGALAAPITLPHLGVIQAQGPDAGTFLQGQLTQDAVSMNATEARAGGYCSAKGRLLANFLMVRADAQTWWLVMHAGLVEPVVKRLKMFVLRAKCTVSSRSDLAVRGTASAELALWQVKWQDENTEAAQLECSVGWWGGRALQIAPASDEQPSNDEATLQAWRHADVTAGWPWIEPSTVEQFVPQMVNFEILGGVNFRKGCYPGQEVVARSQYRGTLKRRMGLFSLDVAGGAAPPAATELFHSADPGQPAGLVVNAVEDPAGGSRVLMLAEVKLAALAEGSLHLGGVDGPLLTPCALPYRIPTESEM